MNDTDRASIWEHRYASGSDARDLAPARVLSENAFLLPHRGVGLDLACGLGANALFLARQGLEAHGWDLAATAIARLSEHARADGLAVRTEQRDVIANPPPPERFDVIVVSRFLHRPLFADLIDALRPGGLLFYETFTCEKAQDVGPSNPDYCLAPNELIRLCSRLTIRAYRDNGRTGEPADGLRNLAYVIGEKT